MSIMSLSTPVSELELRYYTKVITTLLSFWTSGSSCSREIPVSVAGFSASLIVYLLSASQRLSFFCNSLGRMGMAMKLAAPTTIKLPFSMLHFCPYSFGTITSHHIHRIKRSPENRNARVLINSREELSSQSDTVLVIHSSTSFSQSPRKLPVNLLHITASKRRFPHSAHRDLK